MKEPRRIPEATVARLPLYLRALSDGLDRRPGATVSSEVLANRAGVNAAQVRKDLSHLGNYGVRGVGYEVAYLVTQIRRELGLDVDRRVAIVGVGNLGRALANYGGFPERRFRIVAAFDSDPAKVGQVLGETVVRGVEDLVQVVRSEGVAIGVITTPAPFAQSVTDRLVEGGVTSILNFAPTILTVPRGVALRQVDLGVELQILSFYEQHAGGQRGPVPGLAGLPPALAGQLFANPALAGGPLVDGDEDPDEDPCGDFHGDLDDRGDLDQDPLDREGLDHRDGLGHRDGLDHRDGLAPHGLDRGDLDRDPLDRGDLGPGGLDPDDGLLDGVERAWRR